MFSVKCATKGQTNRQLTDSVHFGMEDLTEAFACCAVTDGSACCASLRARIHRSLCKLLSPVTVTDGFACCAAYACVAHGGSRLRRDALHGSNGDG